MMQLDRITLGRQAKEEGFVRDTFEKVCRLADVLTFIESDSLLVNELALKGGTAVNLMIFDLPRLSVDIDMDFSIDADREKMLEDRSLITERIQKHMAADGYILSQKSKHYHALDSFVYEYENAGGVKDNLKIEINYMLRSHVLPPARQKMKLPWQMGESTVLCVDPIELFAAKVVALLNRTAVRDLYDIYNLQKSGIFGDEEKAMLRKCAVLYNAMTAETTPETFDLDQIDRLTYRQIKTDLLPVLRLGEKFDLEDAQKKTKEYLESFLIPQEEELKFWKEFNRHNYCPELIFSDNDCLERIGHHPMALWKCNKENQKTE